MWRFLSERLAEGREGTLTADSPIRDSFGVMPLRRTSMRSLRHNPFAGGTGFDRLTTGGVEQNGESRADQTCPGSEGLQRFAGEATGPFETVGKGNTVAAVAADFQSGVLSFHGLHGVDESSVPDFVLGDGPGPEALVFKDGFAAYAEQAFQVFQDDGPDFLLRKPGEGRGPGAAQEGGQEDVSFRSATREEG